MSGAIFCLLAVLKMAFFQKVRFISSNLPKKVIPNHYPKLSNFKFRIMISNIFLEI